jgi:hypothetical protein
MSRLMGEVDSPTNAQPLTSPQFGGSPEQMMAFLQSPHVQQTLQQWGINFDPSKMRQSPFFPNSFMQHHPHLGGAMSGAMANVAATPEAPLVSGAGSGMTRAMQGMLGGPEMQRQYQVRQMLAPMQAMGMQMPEAEFQRKQQLLEALKQDLDAREAQGQAALRQRGEEQRQKNEAIQPRIYQVPGGYVANQEIPGQPQGGPSGDQFSMQGQSPMRPQIDPSTGQAWLAPGAGLTPETQTQWNSQFHPTDPALLAAQSAAKDPQKGALAKKYDAQGKEITDENLAGRPAAVVGDIGAQTDLRRAQAGTEGAKQGALGARAERDRAAAQNPGGRFGQAAKDRYAQEYNRAEQHAQDQISRVQQLMQMPPDKGGLDKATGEAQIQQWQNWLGTQKENIDRQMGKPGQSAREAGTQQKKTTDLPRPVSPGASPNGGVSSQNPNVALPTPPAAPENPY